MRGWNLASTEILQLRVRRVAAAVLEPDHPHEQQQFDSSTLQLDRFDGILGLPMRLQRHGRLRSLCGQPALGFEFRERPDREPHYAF